MKSNIRHKFFARLQVECVLDRAIKKANHVGSQAVRIVQEDVMTAVLQLEKLRLARLMEPVVLHNGVRTFSIAKEVPRAITEGDWEVKVLKHAVFREKRFMQETEPAEHPLADDILMAPPLGHERVELDSCVSLLLCEVRSGQHRLEVLLAAHFDHPEGHTVQTILDMHVVSVVLDAFVDVRSRG